MFRQRQIGVGHNAVKVDALDDLVADARSGHEEALAALYRELHPALLGFLTGLVPDEAEDLASETWIDAAGCLGTFAGGGADFRRLLFTIARRRAIDDGRKRQRRRTQPTDLARLSEPATTQDPGALVADLDSSLQAIRRIAELLSPAQAEIVLLRVVAGMTVSEVAAVVRRPPAAVSLVQHRALRRLADRMKQSSRPDWESSFR
jgi:RNA polymerase sigma-70 factor (ECF subfamily)